MRMMLWALLLVSGCASGSVDTPAEVANTPQSTTPPAVAPPQVTQPKEEPKKEEPKEEPPPTKPNTITLAFAAHGPGPDGTVQGTFTYVIAQGPIDTNISHLGPNVVYQLETWDITVDSGIEDILPSTRYNHDQIGNSAEFCVGICVFSSSSVIKVTFKNETNRILLLAFELHDPTPFTNPPGTLEEWGPFLLNTSEYRVPCPVCVPVALFKNGIVQEQMKTPATSS